MRYRGSFEAVPGPRSGGPLLGFSNQHLFACFKSPDRIHPHPDHELCRPVICQRIIFVVICLLRLDLPGQSPVVTNHFPFSLSPGQRTRFTLEGENLGGAVALAPSFASEWRLVPTQETGKVVFEVTLPNHLKPGIGTFRFSTTNGLSNPRLLLIDPLPAMAENANNQTLASAQYLKSFVTLNGNANDRASDFFQFTGRKGDVISIDLLAHRLGSPMDPIVRVLDAAGSELAYFEDTPEVGSDVQFHYRAAEAGKFFLEVRDTRYQGGSQQFYCLRFGRFPLGKQIFHPPLGPGLHTRKPLNLLNEQEPNDQPPQATVLSLPGTMRGNLKRKSDRDYYRFQAEKDQRWVFRGRTRSLGSPCDLFFRLLNEKGETIRELDATGPDEGVLTNSFGESGSYTLLVEELNHFGAENFTYEIEADLLPPGFSLTAESDKVEGSTNFTLKLTCNRRDYTGPIELQVDGLDARGEGVIPEKKNEGVLTVPLGTNFLVGAIHYFRVLGKARIKEEEVFEYASTLPALKQNFPLMLHPPTGLDGVIALGIRSSTARVVEEKPKRKRN